jgi:hypothetical protein
MSNSSKRRSQPKPGVLYGVGMDTDGHKRVTKGEGFELMGGTEETHDQMTEKAIKISEKLKKKGKSMGDVGPDEFEEIAQSVGLRRFGPQNN